MKKYLLILAAAMFTLAACNKEPEQKGGDTPAGEDYEETTLTCSVDLMVGVETNNYGTSSIVMPGEQILDFFDMTAEEFYTAMGIYEGTAPNTTQIDNTIQFGVCTGNDHDQMNFCPSSSNNFGCWFDANSAVCTWGDDAVFYTESVIEWGLEEPEQETIDAMWEFAVGFYPDHNTYAVGDQVKHTYFFLKEAEEGSDEKDLYCYVEMVFNIVEAEAVELNVIGEETQEFTVDFNDWYEGYTINFGKATGKLGLSSGAVKVYGVNSDASYSAAAAQNFWFMQDGSLGSWGEGAGICINDDAGTGNWTWCMMPDESNIGKDLKGAVAFYNDNNDAYIINVLVHVNAWPTTFTYDLTIDPSTGDWREGFVPDVQMNIRRALQLTDEELATATFSCDIALCDSETESYDTWYNAEGVDVGWDNGNCIYVGPYHDAGSYFEDAEGNNVIALAYGKYPGALENGTQCTITYVITVNDVELTFILNITAIAINEVVDLNIPTSAAWRVGFFENGQANLLEAFGLDLQGFLDANANGEIDPKLVLRNDSNDYWYNAAGEFTGWDGNQAFYIGGYYDVREPLEGWDEESHDFDFGIAYGVMPGNFTADINFTVFYTIQYTPAEGSVKAYTYQVNVAAYDDAE